MPHSSNNDTFIPIGVWRRCMGKSSLERLLNPALAAGFCLALLGCAAEDVGRQRGDVGQPPSGVVAGAAGAAGAGASNGAFGNAGMGSFLTPIVPIGPMNEDGEVCGATSQSATRSVIETTVEVPVEVITNEPVAIYVVLDRSASMANIDAPGGWGATGGWAGGAGGPTSLWDLAVASIN